MRKILIYGTKWCGDCRRALNILDKRRVPYVWIDIDENPKSEKFVKETNRGNRSVPTILFPDGSILVEPSNKQLDDKLSQIEF